MPHRFLFMCCWLAQWPLLAFLLWQGVSLWRQWSWMGITLRLLALWWLCYIGLYLGMRLHRRERSGDAWFAVLTAPLFAWLLWNP